MNVEASRRPRKRGKPGQFKQLFNDGRVGEKHRIKCDADQVVQVRGILFRLVLGTFQVSDLIPTVPTVPGEFYAAVVKSWLERNPVLKKAEVRDIGDSLDVIVWFDSPVELSGDRERNAWADLTRVIQSILPISAKHPSITATTRAIGSINSLTGSKVTRLAIGEPVTRDEIVGLYREMIDKPFSTVMEIITGQTQLEPCPVCKAKGSSLIGGGDHGSCDDNCGEIGLGQFYDLIFLSQEAQEVIQDA